MRALRAINAAWQRLLGKSEAASAPSASAWVSDDFAVLPLEPAPADPWALPSPTPDIKPSEPQSASVPAAPGILEVGLAAPEILAARGRVTAPRALQCGLPFMPEQLELPVSFGDGGNGRAGPTVASVRAVLLAPSTSTRTETAPADQLHPANLPYNMTDEVGAAYAVTAEPHSMALDYDWPEPIEVEDFGPVVIEAPDVSALEFDPDLRQPLAPPINTAHRSKLARAIERGAAITALLELPDERDRALALSFLTDLFVERPHGATFRAIVNAVHAGADVSTLRAMVALRDVWAERSDWWVCRYRFFHGRRGSDAMLFGADGPDKLPWRTAMQICMARPEYPVEAMIDNDWIAEWHGLDRSDPGYFRFLDFIEDRLACTPARTLHEGLAAALAADDSLLLNSPRPYARARHPDGTFFSVDRTASERRMSKVPNGS